MLDLHVLDYKQLSKIRRIKLEDSSFLSTSHKETLTKEEIEKLFTNIINIEEKIDGSPEVRDFEEYCFFGENMRIRHSIYYNRLPAFFIVYDVWNKEKQRFVDRQYKEKLCAQYGFEVVPLLFRGVLSLNAVVSTFIIPRIHSQYSNSEESIEGITIKNYQTQIFAKIIRTEFQQGISLEENYRRQRRNADEKYNRIQKIWSV